MSPLPTNLGIGLVLILPSFWLLWYAHGHPEFYRDRSWEKWRGRAALLGMIFSLVHRLGGPDAVKRSFQLFALLCIGVGLWAVWSTS